jgi:hypothetical protein
MRTLPRIVALSITALAFGGAAFAQDVQSKASEVRTVYEGVDAQGRIVKVTVTSSAGNPAVAVATPSAPELHWTAHIGSGNAASIPH